jgi:hypothetical protein
MDSPLVRFRGTLLRKPNSKYVKYNVQGRDFYKIPFLVVQVPAATKNYKEELAIRRENEAQIYNVSSRGTCCLV